MDQARANLPEDQSSTQKRKKYFFIIFLIIFFSLIIFAIISVFTALKHHTESQSLSADPTAAIWDACRATRYYFYCTDSLSLLHNNNPRHKIYASDIFRLSIHAAFHKFLIIYQLPQKFSSKINNKSNRAVLIECQNLFNDSFDQFNRSLIMIKKTYVGPNEEILDYDDEMMGDLRNLMDHATKNVNRCLNGLDAGEGATQPEIVMIKNVRERIQQAEIQMMISLAILENKNLIREIFDPSLQSILASFMLKRENYVLSIVVLCSQYLFLVFLFCSLLRVFR